MKVPVLNTIPQIQNAIAELYQMVSELQDKKHEEVEVQAEPRRGRPRKAEAENQEG